MGWLRPARSARREAPTPVVPPPLGDSDDDDACVGDARNEALLRRLGQQRQGLDARHALNGESGIREQPARVGAAPARIRPGADQDES
jgi:hypothetical protein